MLKQFSAFCLLTALLLCSCGSSPAEEQTYIEPPEPLVLEFTTDARGDTAYQELIDTVFEAFRTHWNSNDHWSIGVSPKYDQFEECIFGWARLDYDGDGTDEIFLAEYLPGEPSPIFDAYTQDEEGQIVHFFSGDEYSYLYLHGDTLTADREGGDELKLSLFPHPR